ncbi:hypothetical protein TH19_21275 [Thalassospira profundimaris]|uniref:Uncharacterized protein n=2 Tax=Thalassospira TaxID=168934 RepID=A0A367VZ62_9PROT|nr:hypothetical protein TH19_21275 [Thalassospira profundimaris]
MAIRSGTIFNGGALVALIPVTANAYFKISELAPPERIIHTKVIDGLVSAATVFVIGLVISGFSSFIAFFGEFYYTNFHLTNNCAFKGKARMILFAGAAAVLLSLILFAVGSYTAIHSFQNASGL